MTVLDDVTKMQQQGMQDSEISTQLQNHGISPQEINDALNQAKIKSAVAQEQYSQQPAAIQGMQQSIMQPPTEQSQPAEQLQQYPEMQSAPSPTQEQSYQYPATPQAYPEQAYYPQQPALDTDTIIEIAEQVVSEKFSEFLKKTGDLASFKLNIQEKVQDIDDRLKRIEATIDSLQQAINAKIGEFGESTAAIHKDLNALHNTTSKLMNPLIDNYRELKKIIKSKK